VNCFTFYCRPGFVPGPWLGKKGLVKCHMSASQVLNAPTYYTTLAANDALPDPTFCNQSKPWKPIAFHRCRSRQIFGCAKDFAQISRNLSEKTLKKMTSTNDCTSFHFGCIFSNQSTSSTIFAQISLNLPEKELKKHDLQKRKRLHFDFGRHFSKIKAHKRFSQDFHTFCPNLHRFFPDFKGFFPDFHYIKIFWGGLPPPAPPPPTPLALNLLLKTFTQLVWMAEKAVFPHTHLIRFAWNVRIQRSPHPWRKLSLKFRILQ